MGTKRLLEILEKITLGKATMEDLDKMEALCFHVKENSLCGLGQTAPNPILSTYHYFKEEYIAHVVEKRCPAGVCKNLISYEILEEECIGCTACAKKCPVAAISGEIKKPHQIDQAICIKCGVCLDTCRFHAISVG
ncbi:indolepyruvate ferredoxin oxidoreductase subunit alpha [Enterococcus rivorum]|uniref:indolepyruvate ferredoxin oxidoreductase subunit alpha n=1 Tax=Enterococcus rivorum TaxID=762845 RepID=UPI003641C699